MLLILFLPYSLVAGTLDWASDQKAYLERKKEILMCVDPSWMPYEKIENGKHVGMTKDYMELFSERIGIPITMVATENWCESLEYAKARKCDIFSLAMATPDREVYMNFTKPYLSVPLVIATGIDKLFIADIQEVLDKPLGVVKGYAFAELLRLKYPGIHLIEVESTEDGLRRVSKKELYGFVGTLSSVGYAIQKSYIGELKVVGKFDESWELGVGVRNDDPMLLGIFEKVIDSLQHNEKQAILDKWISVKYDRGFDYGLLWKVLGLFALAGAFFTYRHFELLKHNRQLQELSVTDNLTGLYNRLKIDRVLQTQLDLYNRYKIPFCLLMLDIDHFKELNDNMGHQYGDNALVMLSNILKKEMRSSDIAGRWGGEEFMMILPGTQLSGGVDFAEKLRKSVESLHLQPCAMTVSIGVTEVGPSDFINIIVKRADDALYLAKENGRNRVESMAFVSKSATNREVV